MKLSSRSLTAPAAALALTAPLWILLVVPGWIAWTLISIWFLYRIVKGMVAMNASRPLPR